MRTTVALDNDLLADAQELTGIREKSALLREALTALVQREAGRRLILLGGSDPTATAGPRRRPLSLPIRRYGSIIFDSAVRRWPD